MKLILIFFLTISLAFANKIAVIKVDGMTCPLCTTAIKKSLKKIKGVIKAKVILNSEKATVCFNEGVNPKQLLKAIEDVGYKGTILEIR